MLGHCGRYSTWSSPPRLAQSSVAPTTPKSWIPHYCSGNAFWTGRTAPRPQRLRFFITKRRSNSVQLSRRAQSRGDLTQAPRNRTENQARRRTHLSAPKQAPSQVPTRETNTFRTALEVYSSLEIVGAGGAGVVHRVVTDDGQVFALKLLNADKATCGGRQRANASGGDLSPFNFKLSTFNLLSPHHFIPSLTQRRLHRP